MLTTPGLFGIVAQLDDVQIDHIRTSYSIVGILQLVNTLGGTGRIVIHLHERYYFRLGHLHLEHPDSTCRDGLRMDICDSERV